MNESSNIVPKASKPHDGPMRDTAHGILKREIAALRRKADECEALLKAIGPVEVGSPAEAALWQILQQRRGNDVW